MKGRLVVFEGGEGSGKTTQIQRSQAWLTQTLLPSLFPVQAPKLITTREPGGTALGQSLRHLLLNSKSTLGELIHEPIQPKTELLLYAADRAHHVEAMLIPMLETGALILCDRFTDSTIAYQGYGRGLDRGLIDLLNQIATSGLQSDLTLWLDVDMETGLARAQRRGSADRIEQSKLDFHERVHQGFAELAQINPDRIVQIDANKPEEEVSQQIQAILHTKIQEWYV